MEEKGTEKPRITSTGRAARLGGHWTRLLPSGIAFTSLVVAGFIAPDQLEDEAARREAVRTEARLEAASALEHVEEYLASVHNLVRLISLDPDVLATSPTGREHLQAVFDDEFTQHRLAEIYVVEREFDGTRPPFQTFEYGSGDAGVEEVHSLEREEDEYRVIMEQMRRFEAQPRLRAQFSERVTLCVVEPGRRVVDGFVYSVPIRGPGDLGRLVGLAAGMVPSHRLRAELDRGTASNPVVLANANGVVVASEGLPTDVRTWFEERLRRRSGVEQLVAGAPETLAVGEWTALWAPAEIRSGTKWWLFFLYDAEAEIRADMFLYGWLGFAGTLLFGMTLAILAHTVRRRTEAEMLHLREARELAEQRNAAERRFLAVVDNAPVVAFSARADDALAITFASERVAEWTGHAAKEICEEKELWPSLIHQEDLPQVAAGSVQQSDAAQARSTVFRLRDREGSYRWIQAEAEPVRDESGEVVRVDGVMTDITERRRAEESLGVASRMEATTTLAAGIAHDLNNLMAAVVANARVARRDAADGALPTAILEDIETAAKRAGSLAQQMLAFARGGKYQPQVLDLDSTIREVVSLTGHVAPLGIQFECNREAGLWSIRADPTQMAQVVMNLCMNAVEASGNEGRIVITARNVVVDEERARAQKGLKPGRHVRLTVEDAGCGMSDETLSKVFEPFFSTKRPGRGLGLAAVYGIVQNHRGHISVRSEEGRGTRVEVLLPATEATATKRARRPLSTPFGAETILVVDDEELVLRATQRLLRRFGYRVLTARDGSEALEVARSFEGEIALTLLDIRMPVMSGVEAFPQLVEARPQMKVVICSGYEHDVAAQGLLDAGAAAFVQKPYDPDKLGKTIREALDG